MRERDRVTARRPQPFDHAVGPGSDLIRRLASRAAVAPQHPVGVDARGSRAWSGPRTRRNPTRAGRRTAPSPPPKPASSHVSRARRSGLHRTSAKRRPASASASVRARSRPFSVSGRSVRLVCRPYRLHSVSPWRTTTIWISGDIAAESPLDARRSSPRRLITRRSVGRSISRLRDGRRDVIPARGLHRDARAPGPPGAAMQDFRRVVLDGLFGLV